MKVTESSSRRRYSMSRVKYQLIPIRLNNCSVLLNTIFPGQYKITYLIGLVLAATILIECFTDISQVYMALNMSIWKQIYLLKSEAEHKGIKLSD